MSPANPPAKRRRHGTASSTLSKPFKSPLRKAPSPMENPSPPSSAINPDSKNEPEGGPKEETEKEAKEANASITPPSTRTPNPAITSRTPPSTKPKPVDPTLSSLQKNHRTLQSRLAALRSELDTVAQAYRIETSSKDAELEALITRWRAAAQNAADEVFAGARERVTRMGGMMGYRQRIAAARGEEQNEGWFGGRADLDAEDMDRGFENGTEDGKKEDEEEEEVAFLLPLPSGMLTWQEFTMEFMLKTLNIDPKVIGFDSAGQRWVK